MILNPDLLFKPKLSEEINNIQIKKYFVEGDTIIDIDNNLRLMQILISGVLKILKEDHN